MRIARALAFAWSVVSFARALALVGYGWNDPASGAQTCDFALSNASTVASVNECGGLCFAASTHVARCDLSGCAFEWTGALVLDNGTTVNATCDTSHAPARPPVVRLSRGSWGVSSTEPLQDGVSDRSVSAGEWNTPFAFVFELESEGDRASMQVVPIAIAVSILKENAVPPDPTPRVPNASLCGLDTGDAVLGAAWVAPNASVTPSLATFAALRPIAPALDGGVFFRTYAGGIAVPLRYAWGAGQNNVSGGSAHACMVYAVTTPQATVQAGFGPSYEAYAWALADATDGVIDAFAVGRTRYFSPRAPKSGPAVRP